MSPRPPDQEFSLRFDADGDRIGISVVGSTQGEVRSLLEPPCSAMELADLRRRWQQAILAKPPRASRGEMLPWGESTLGDELRELAGRLHRSVFPEPIRRLWDGARAHADRDGVGLALRLSFDPREPRTASLASLPWELIANAEPGRHGFLALDPTTPLYRHLELRGPSRPLELRPPLGILLIVSAPRDQPELAVADEREAILRRWGREEGVTVDTLEAATLPALREALASRRHQIVHFIGHGVFDERCGRGALVFEDVAGRSAVVSDEAVAAQFRGHDRVGLVVLNACEGARSPALPVHPTFAGVATCLVDQGVPAVVAMQFAIGDVAAVAFGTGLHRALARGQDVRRAVVEGRMAILDEIPGSPQWITPALFLRHAAAPRPAADQAPAEPFGNAIQVDEVHSERFVAGGVVHLDRGRPGASGGGGGHRVEIRNVHSNSAVFGGTIFGGGRDES